MLMKVELSAQPSFIEYFDLETRSDATALISSMTVRILCLSVSMGGTDDISNPRACFRLAVFSHVSPSLGFRTGMVGNGASFTLVFSLFTFFISRRRVFEKQ